MTEPAFVHDTRDSYDTVAGTYRELARIELPGKPLDRAMLSGFAELVRDAGGARVADIGCGPGHVTAYLHGLGLDVFGIDLSPRMVETARRDHPGLRFREGSMLSLDLPDGELGGIVAMYSLIHIPTAYLPGVLDGFRRALAPGGYLLTVFQIGDEPVHYDEGFGHAVSLDFHRRQPELVTGLLAEAGLPVHARMVREPVDYPGGTEKTRQAYLIARRPPV